MLMIHKMIERLAADDMRLVVLIEEALEYLPHQRQRGPEKVELVTFLRDLKSALRAWVDQDDGYAAVDCSMIRRDAGPDDCAVEVANRLELEGRRVFCVQLGPDWTWAVWHRRNG